MFIETHKQEGTKNPLTDLEKTFSRYRMLMFGFSICVLIIHMMDAIIGGVNDVFIQGCFSTIFFIDFLYSWLNANDKVKYLKTNGIDLFLSFWFYPTTWMVVTLSLRAVKCIVEFVLSKIQTAYTSMLIIGIALVCFSTVSILQFETIDGCNIKSFWDAVWWSVCTITTVGYGDKFPITSGGKVIAIILMGCGIGLFGTLIGYISSYFTDKEKNNNDKVDTIEELSHQINELRNELKQTKK